MIRNDTIRKGYKSGTHLPLFLFKFQHDIRSAFPNAMKNTNIPLLLLASLILFCACSEGSTNPIETIFPEPASVESETAAESEAESEVESEAEIQFSANTEHLLLYHTFAIGSLLDRVYREEDREAYLKWIESMPQEACCEGRCGGYFVDENIYQFIRDFSIPREEYEEVLYMEGSYYFSYVDLDILYNSTAEEASEAFSFAHFEEWDDGHREKEDSIKSALRALVWDTAGTKDTWFQWQTEKGYDSFTFKHKARKSENMPNTWFSLTELVHRFDISRADFEAIVERCGKYNGTTFDIDRIFDGYEELMRLQEEEDLYPVEVDRLCWTGPAWAPGSMDDGSPEQIEIFPDDPDTPVETTPAEDVETVPGAGGEPVRGIDVETVPS